MGNANGMLLRHRPSESIQPEPPVRDRREEFKEEPVTSTKGQKPKPVMRSGRPKKVE